MLSQTHGYDWFVQFPNTVKSIAGHFMIWKLWLAVNLKKKILSVTNVSELSVNQEETKSLTCDL